MSIDYQLLKAERHGTEDFIKPAEKCYFSGTDIASQTAQAYLLTTTFLFYLPSCGAFTQIGLIRPSLQCIHLLIHVHFLCDMPSFVCLSKQIHLDT